MKAYWPWLALYVGANIIATLIMWNTGELIGDTSGIRLYSKSSLFWAALLVVSSYLIILWPVFNFISKIKIKKWSFGANDIHVGERIGKLLVLLQIAFMIFNISNGVNIAGSSNTRTTASFSMFWVLMPVDALFLVYYGVYRSNKYFYPNVIIWLVSNLLRGWSGILMFGIFFEWCRAFRNKKITVFRIVLLGMLVIFLYPVLASLKWFLRASAGTDLSVASIGTGLGDAFKGVDYFSLIGDGVSHLIGRFQVTSIVVEVMRLSDLLQVEFANQKFTPFWLEGLHGIVFSNLFSGEKYLSVGVAFTKYGNFGSGFDIGDWNTNIGYVGWFFVAPYLTPIYIFYTLVLGLISFYLVKKIGISESSKDMLWLVWLVYLMPPWLAAFVGFIYALFLFLIMKIVFTRLPQLRFVPRSFY